MKCAAAHLRRGKILIQAFSQTTAGVWIGYGPVYVASGDDEPCAIGVKILAALDNSLVGVRHPLQNEWKGIQAPILEAAGVKSWATFEKGSIGVGVDDHGDFIVITPTASDVDGGKALPDKVIRSKKDNQQLGAALLQAFAACE